MNVLPILAVTLMGLPNMLGMNVKAPATNVERRAWVTRERKTKVLNGRFYIESCGFG